MAPDQIHSCRVCVCVVCVCDGGKGGDVVMGGGRAESRRGIEADAEGSMDQVNVKQVRRGSKRRAGRQAGS